jgi:hypothetical protein
MRQSGRNITVCACSALVFLSLLGTFKIWAWITGKWREFLCSSHVHMWHSQLSRCLLCLLRTVLPSLDYWLWFQPWSPSSHPTISRWPRAQQPYYDWVLGLYRHVNECKCRRVSDSQSDLLDSLIHNAWLQFTVHCYTHSRTHAHAN